MANIERLTVLRDFLLALPPEKVDLSLWSNRCGTLACAVGWACTIPEFNEAGLVRWQRSEDDSIAPYYNRLHSWDAVEAFFELSMDEASALFSHDKPGWVSAGEVLDLVRRGESNIHGDWMIIMNRLNNYIEANS